MSHYSINLHVLYLYIKINYCIVCIYKCICFCLCIVCPYQSTIYAVSEIRSLAHMGESIETNQMYINISRIWTDSGCCCSGIELFVGPGYYAVVMVILLCMRAWIKAFHFDVGTDESMFLCWTE